MASYTAEYLKSVLEKFPQVESADKIEIENNIIKYISIETKIIGRITAQQLNINDSSALFDFYFNGLSEKPRRLFIPYPLFHTPPRSADELAHRIAEWKKEDDWTAIKLMKDEQIIGLGLLKRFRKKQVTSGVIIRDDYLRMGLGYLLQIIIIGQARLLHLKKFHVKIISDNIASLRLHEKCGFKQTKVVPATGYEDLLDFLNKSDIDEGVDKTVNRKIIEMVIELDYE